MPLFETPSSSPTILLFFEDLGPLELAALRDTIIISIGLPEGGFSLRMSLFQLLGTLFRLQVAAVAETEDENDSMTEGAGFG